MYQIKQKLKFELRAFVFYIKAYPKLFKLITQVLCIVPKFDAKLRKVLLSDESDVSFRTVDIISKVENPQRLTYLRTIKQEIETVKKEDMNQYNALVKLVNDNLALYNMEPIDVDLYDNVYMDLHHCSEQALLSIKDNADFIKEVFLKLLNRSIDKPHLNNLLERMNTGKLNRQMFIKDVYNSNERRAKKTDIIFDVN